MTNEQRTRTPEPAATIPLDVFIAGESIDLCIPTREFAEKSDWYSWLNDPALNRYLDRGLFPNDREAQVHFFETQKESRLLLIISTKQQNHLGVISFSDINLKKRSASVALIVNSRKEKGYAPILALEAMARITEHGFNVMGLDRISAGQHEELSGWQQRMELLGYRLEGIFRKGFVKGRDLADSVSIAVTYDDYLAIKEHRGEYWDSSERMMTRIKELPKRKFVDSLKQFFQEDGDEYYRALFRL